MEGTDVKEWFEACVKDLEQTELFSGISAEEIPALLACLRARREHYGKDEFIIEEGDVVCDFGILLSGHGRAVKWDASGRLILISLLEKGSEVGVMIASGVRHRSPVTVQATDEVSLLVIPYDRVLAWCGKGCHCHQRFIGNYMRAVAEKGLLLHQRIDCLLRPSVREKILAYLGRVSREQEGRTISIPLDRSGMAEYLNVERSALSRELSSMKREGLIDYHKNSFRIL